MGVYTHIMRLAPVNKHQIWETAFFTDTKTVRERETQCLLMTESVKKYIQKNLLTIDKE